MPGLSGLELQEHMAAAGLTMPIIFITGHGNIPISVRAMKAGAVDFLEKPFDDQALLDAIHRAIAKDTRAKQAQAKIREINQRVASLTPREQEVFTLVVTGMLNKQIAFELGITESTIKVHRAQVMQKMSAESFADLVRLAEKAGVLETAMGNGNDRSRASRLGHYLKRQRGKVVGGQRITGGKDSVTKTMRWSLLQTHEQVGVGA